MEILDLCDSSFFKEDIVEYLFEVNEDFKPSLTKRLSIKSNVQTIDDYVSKLIKYGIIKICEIDSEISGLIGFYVNDMDCKVAYIPILTVKSKYAKRKIGSLLVKQAIDYIKQLDFKVIKVETWKENLPALALYQRNGFIIEEENGENISLIYTL